MRNTIVYPGEKCSSLPILGLTPFVVRHLGPIGTHVHGKRWKGVYLFLFFAQRG